jgi:hypothetical protein
MGYMLQWSPDGKGIYYVGLGDAKDNVWYFSLEDHKERPATALIGRRGAMGENGLGTDGHDLYFTWGEPRGDIWVADIITTSKK